MERNLRAAAIEAGVKGVDLARHFRVAPQTVSKWLARRTSVPDKLKREFASMIGVDVAELVPPKPIENTRGGER
jgi:hypothetical protein